MKDKQKVRDCSKCEFYTRLYCSKYKHILNNGLAMMAHARECDEYKEI